MNKKLTAFLTMLYIVLTVVTGAAAETLQFGERELKIGDRGEDVAVMQEFLNEHGFREGHVDGVFGPLTYGSLLAFQENDLQTDGVLAGETLVLMQELLSAKTAVTAKTASTAAVVERENNQTLRQQTNIILRKLNWNCLRAWYMLNLPANLLKARWQ